MAKDYRWREIEDLPEDVRPLTNNELRPLHKIWTERKPGLGDRAALNEFRVRLKREWAIETGIIEGVYVFDRGVTSTLIEHGVNSSLIPRQPGNLTPEHVATIIQDHAEVFDWLFDFVKGDRELTVGYIKELHAALLRHQDTTIAMTSSGDRIEVPLERGTYKLLPNNPVMPDGSIHEYCPPEHVASEMERMIHWHKEHLSRGVPDEVEAAWLHHRFTQIHPFQDGNGRVARAIASLVFIKADWFPLIVRPDEKVKYLDALEDADFGNLEPLVSNFSSGQKRIFLMALDCTLRARPAADIDAAIASARNLFIGLGKGGPPEWETARKTADRLYDRAVKRLGYAVNQLRAELSSVNSGFRFELLPLVSRNNEIQNVADGLHYSANLEVRNQTVELRLETGRSAALAISFHGVGNMFRGILAASAFLVTSDGKTTPCCDDFFQINYEEPQADAETRFDKWLEESIVRGLDLWQRWIVGDLPS
jgi:fido (protein-threonine AMPylation protein)